MRNIFSKFALVAIFGIAITFTFSCSSDDDESVSCSGEGGSLSYKGKTYRTVKIGKQTWMAENLNYDVSGSKCYNDLEANCKVFGRLYEWATAMALPSDCNSRLCSSQIAVKHQGICPPDWHIPSKSEWETLINFVGGNAGKYLKATSGWNENGNGKDKCRFSALPGGYYGYYTGSYTGVFNFYNVGRSGSWWSSSEYVYVDDEDSKASFIGAYLTYIFDNSFDPYIGGVRRSDEFHSVRCLQD